MTKAFWQQDGNNLIRIIMQHQYAQNNIMENIKYYKEIMLDFSEVRLRGYWMNRSPLL